MTPENKPIDPLDILPQYETGVPYDLMELIEIMTDIALKYQNIPVAKNVVRILANKNTNYFQSLDKENKHD